MLHKQIFQWQDIVVTKWPFIFLSLNPLNLFKLLTVLAYGLDMAKVQLRLVLRFLTATNDVEECWGLCQKVGCGFN